MRKRIAILGSTGSIGTQTLDVVARYPDKFIVEALAAGSNLDKLREQIRHFRPKLVSVGNAADAETLRSEFPSGVRIVHGDEGLLESAAGTEADYVVSAVVGSRGLKPTLAAIEAGKQIGLANKETLVAAGEIVMAAAERHGVALMPIDSEHSAIFQCLNGEREKTVSKLVLTASGGSFRDRTREQLKGVTVEEALAHPNWSMGTKITIDSATMVNKGLEVIEAHWLFNMPYDQIEVLLHPQSVIHSMVEFTDCSVMAQLGLPDMRVPIQYALTYPDRLPSLAPRLDLAQLACLDFKAMDFDRFPCLKLAYDAGRAGGTAPAVYNAANEQAVELFGQGVISFLAIETLIERTLTQVELIQQPSLEDVLAADVRARQIAVELGGSLPKV